MHRQPARMRPHASSNPHASACIVLALSSASTVPPRSWKLMEPSILPLFCRWDWAERPMAAGWNRGRIAAEHAQTRRPRTPTPTPTPTPTRTQPQRDATEDTAQTTPRRRHRGGDDVARPEHATTRRTCIERPPRATVLRAASVDRALDGCPRPRRGRPDDAGGYGRDARRGTAGAGAGAGAACRVLRSVTRAQPCARAARVSASRRRRGLRGLRTRQPERRGHGVLARRPHISTLHSPSPLPTCLAAGSRPADVSVAGAMEDDLLLSIDPAWCVSPGAGASAVGSPPASY